MIKFEKKCILSTSPLYFLYLAFRLGRRAVFPVVVSAARLGRRARASTRVFSFIELSLEMWHGRREGEIIHLEARGRRRGLAGGREGLNAFLAFVPAGSAAVRSRYSIYVEASTVRDENLIRGSRRLCAPERSGALPSNPRGNNSNSSTSSRPRWIYLFLVSLSYISAPHSSSPRQLRGFSRISVRPSDEAR